MKSLISLLDVKIFSSGRMVNDKRTIVKKSLGVMGSTLNIDAVVEKITITYCSINGIKNESTKIGLFSKRMFFQESLLFNHMLKNIND